ncbi:unnamed protein product [Chondrus crispus]|uniref:Uncharacterized protein n=1 Tax=Chondrus crispus TaxID=2769 RepID=R7QBX6_CHOCR|nr:unnamed protein product [Chondrus crispus]CDF35303.1 unnamed protein product [Chondrus crispus]|eukprot:XP_005715122.1 unnamed protein product [Chondrus crispus]
MDHTQERTDMDFYTFDIVTVVCLPLTINIYTT